MTFDDLIQQAIKKAKIPLVRRSLRHRYEANPEAFRKHVAAVARMNEDDEFAEAIESGQEVDPEQIKRWLEIIIKLLPLILLLF
jgi:CTP synthase (UTP-ammonia lyase)